LGSWGNAILRRSLETSDGKNVAGPGGPLAVPYVVPDGSELVLYVLGKEVARAKAAALTY
jgi:hypothetical protein